MIGKFLRRSRQHGCNAVVARGRENGDNLRWALRRVANGIGKLALVCDIGAYDDKRCSLPFGQQDFGRVCFRPFPEWPPVIAAKIVADDLALSIACEHLRDIRQCVVDAAANDRNGISAWMASRWDLGRLTFGCERVRRQQQRSNYDSLQCNPAALPMFHRWRACMRSFP